MTDTPAQETTEDPPPKKFGAFGGVCTPSLLTILGVIIFVYNAGEVSIEA